MISVMTVFNFLVIIVCSFHVGYLFGERYTKHSNNTIYFDTRTLPTGTYRINGGECFKIYQGVECK